MGVWRGLPVLTKQLVIILHMQFIPNLHLYQRHRHNQQLPRVSLHWRKEQWHNKFFLVILYVVDRWAQIKGCLSRRALEDLTLTVSLGVSQNQPWHFIKQIHAGLKESNQSMCVPKHGTLCRKEWWWPNTGTSRTATLETCCQSSAMNYFSWICSEVITILLPCD